MSGEDSILATVRKSLVGPDNTEFDDEFIPHINSAIAKLNQNGIGRFVFVEDESQIWDNLKDVIQVKGNEYFRMVPLYVILNTKILFDPPPPSNVEYHKNSIDELLWRLKIAYEE